MVNRFKNPDQFQDTKTTRAFFYGKQRRFRIKKK